MFQLSKMRAWVKWPLVRAHLCTLAVSVGLGSSWRVPREGLRYGGAQYALVLTAAMAVALPLCLLQLALGQLSQQDAVGIWRAVPFFKGVGYIRLLVSFVGCVYSMIHVALTINYFLKMFNRSTQFDECFELDATENDYANTTAASNCLNVTTYLDPGIQNPEYYISMALIIVFLWIVLPFLLYSPVKLMKRIFYVLGPVLVVVGIATVSGVGSGARLAGFHNATAWGHLAQPRVWLGAVTQALLSTQVAGGYLISAGDAIYSSNDVQWTALIFVGSNVVASWAGLLFWIAVTDTWDPDTSSAAVLVQMYRATKEGDVSVAWAMVVYAALFLSGIVTILTVLFPVFDRIRRSGGGRWRVVCASAALLGALLSLAALAGGEAALSAAEDTAVPLLVAVATILELVVFVFIYGWKTLKEDVEFLIGQELSKYWVMGWCVAPGVIAPLTVWWLVVVVTEGAWSEAPWSASVVVATGALALLLILFFAAVVVARQVQYDIIGKLKSSFQPSRHWGPRDPITHYYWLARREEAERGEQPRSRYRRRQLGQLSGGPSFLIVSEDPILPNKDIDSNEFKRRSNSDDWIYTVYRKKYLQDAFNFIAKGKRTKSLDWGKLPRLKVDSNEFKMLGSVYLTPVESAETVFKDAISDDKNSSK